jgi:predicted ATP-dependent protease
VISRLSELALRQLIETIQESDKIAEYRDQRCINADHVRIALDNIKEKNNFVDPEEVEKISKEKNAFKPQVMAEDSIVNTTNQENILLKPTKHLRDIR